MAKAKEADDKISAQMVPLDKRGCAYAHVVEDDMQKREITSVLHWISDKNRLSGELSMHLREASIHNGENFPSLPNMSSQDLGGSFSYKNTDISEF